MALSRADTSTLGRWWWTVDRWTLGALAVLIGFGYLMMLAASPAVAERIHVLAQTASSSSRWRFLLIAGCTIVAVSLLSPKGVRRLAMAGCLLALAATVLTLVAGVEIKGARRWISVPGMTVQPSEFLKPCFAVVAAWLLAEGKRTRAFPGMIIAFAVYGLIALLLKSQPDIGMLAVVTAVFFAQLFVSGLNLFFVGVGAACLAGGGVGAYAFFPHVRSRVTRFLDPAAGDNYQVSPRAGGVRQWRVPRPRRGRGPRQGTCSPTPMPTSSTP